MIKIGLTGGIGSGKSTVAKCFAKFKIPIIDADEIVHELLQPKTPEYKKIVNYFGKDFLTAKGLLDRKKIRDVIFSNNKDRIWLENLLHPRVRVEMQRRVAKLQAPYCIMVVPLFFETKFPIKVERILVVDCPKTIQIKRIREREHLQIKQIQAIIKTQINRKLRLQKADDIISNDSDVQNLRKIVKKTHNYYLSLI